MEEEKSKKYISDVEVVENKCDANEPWDIFCGKVQEEKNRESKLEVWIDISRSMSSVDFPDKDKFCYRKIFAKNLIDKCKSITINGFSDSLITSINPEYLCDAKGFNETNRFLSWIKLSKAKKLIIITDKSFASKGIYDFFSRKGGKTLGDAPGKEITGKNLLDKVDSLVKTCQ